MREIAKKRKSIENTNFQQTNLDYKYTSVSNSLI